MDNKKASEAILKGINYIIENKINKAPMDKTFNGLIKTVRKDNLYDVLIQGKVYPNIPSMISGLEVNDIVKVKSPQNQYSQMYIEGKYNELNLKKIKDMENKIQELENKINTILEGGMS